VSAEALNRGIGQSAAMRFPRTARLLKHSDFERVYKQGRRHFSSHMTVFYLRQVDGVSPQDVSSERTARIGFTVGKALGGAVVRNRIKRRMRDAVRQRRKILMTGADGMDVDIVINPKKSVLSLDFAIVLEEVGRAFETIARKLVTK